MPPLSRSTVADEIHRPFTGALSRGNAWVTVCARGYLTGSRIFLGEPLPYNSNETISRMPGNEIPKERIYHQRFRAHPPGSISGSKRHEDVV